MQLLLKDNRKGENLYDVFTRKRLIILALFAISGILLGRIALRDEVMKNISALLWVNENTVPTVMAYGKYDTFQPYLGSARLEKALAQNGIDHQYFVREHSGQGLQNDDKVYAEYRNAVEEYLAKYMPVSK